MQTVIKERVQTMQLEGILPALLLSVGMETPMELLRAQLQTAEREVAE